jgi:excisionase family DNA binding protein
MADNHKRLVDVEEMASILGVSTLTIYRKVKTGDIPVVRVGRLLRFDPEAVKAALAR